MAHAMHEQSASAGAVSASVGGDKKSSRRRRRTGSHTLVWMMVTATALVPQLTDGAVCDRGYADVDNNETTACVKCAAGTYTISGHVG